VAGCAGPTPTIGRPAYGDRGWPHRAIRGQGAGHAAGGDVAGFLYGPPDSLRLEIVIALPRILVTWGNRLNHHMPINNPAHDIPKSFEREPGCEFYLYVG
jgi:hypothetical protein